MNAQLLAWPGHWSRQQRATATMASAGAVLIALLWLMSLPLSLAPEPIGSNAVLFAEGTLITVQLTLTAGLAGIAIGVLAAVGRTSRVLPLRWAASLYIWVVRGTPLLVQILFVFLALPPLVNNTVALLKDSSLAYAIGVVELTNVGNRIQAASFQPLPTLATTALIYLTLTTVLTQISGAVERRYDVEGRQP